MDSLRAPNEVNAVRGLHPAVRGLMQPARARGQIAQGDPAGRRPIGQKNFRSFSEIARSLMLAIRRRMRPFVIEFPILVPV